MESTYSKHYITEKLLSLSTVFFNLHSFRHMILNPDDEIMLQVVQHSALATNTFQNCQYVGLRFPRH